MSAADDDLDSYAEILAARAKARMERLQKMKTADPEPKIAAFIDKENTDNNQTVTVDVKVDTPVCEVVDCSSNGRKQDIASKRARRFEDILKRSEDEENSWETKRPDYKNAKRSEGLNSSWTPKSPKLHLTPTVITERSFNESPQKKATVEIKPVVVKEWNKPKDSPVKEVEKPKDLNIEFSIKKETQKESNIFLKEQEKPKDLNLSTVKQVKETKELNIQPSKKVEQPKDLQNFFTKSKEEENASDRSKKFLETVNMFQNLQQNASSKEDVDPSELPLNARKALFENAMFRGSEAKRPRKDNPTPYIPQPKVLFTQTYTTQQAKDVLEIESMSNNSFVNEDQISQSETNTDMEITNVSTAYEKESNLTESKLSDTADQVNDSVLSALKDIDDLSDMPDAEQSTGRLYPELPTLEESEASFSYALESSPTKNDSNSRIYAPEVPQLSPIKKFTPLETNDNAKPILRTLSTYRREQKALAAMNSPQSEAIDAAEKMRLEKEKKIKEEKQKANETIESLRVEVAEKHNTVIAQSTAALNVIFSSGDFVISKERLEAEKILLIATQKRIRCVNEIQRLKQCIDKNQFCFEAVSGTVLAQTILVHVKGDFVLSQIGKYDKFRHYFICLLHVNGKVNSTELLSASDVIENACLTFTNNTPFNCLKSDFKMEIEVYGLALPKNVPSKKEGPKFLTLTPKSKSKQKNQSSPKSPNIIRSSNFSRLGYAEIDMKNRFNTKHNLREFVHDSPLEGTIEVIVKTTALHEVSMKGDLNFLEVVDGFRSWNRRWCVLKGYFLAYWRFAEDETAKESIGVIDLRQCVNPSFGPLPYEVCSRKNSFAIVTQTTTQKTVKDTYKTVSTTMQLIATDMKQEFDVWCSKLQELVSNIRLWEIDAVRPFDASNFEKALN